MKNIWLMFHIKTIFNQEIVKIIALVAAIGAKFDWFTDDRNFFI